MSGEKNTTKKEASVDTEALTAQITQIEQEKNELTNKLEISEAQVDNLNQEKKDVLEQKEAVELEKEALESQNKEILKENKDLKKLLAEPKLTSIKKEITKEDFLKNRPTVEIDGQKFAFKFDAPSSLRIKGVVREINELIKDEKIMAEFVYGNAFFVESVN